MDPRKVTGVVLAGGQSRRMGSDKASLVVGGKPMIVHAIERVRAALPLVVVVAKDACHLHTAGVRVFSDTVCGKSGALVGIYSALRIAHTPYVFVVACDMPHIRPELVRWMVEAYDGSDAFVPRVGSQIEPLFAIYSQACLSSIEKRIRGDDLRVRGFFEDVNTAYVEEDALRAVDPNLASFVNINTKEDLESFRRLLGPDTAGNSPVLQVAKADTGSYRTVKLTKVRDAGSETEAVSESQDTVIAETEVQILLDGEAVCVVQCSPHGLEDLAVGRLLTEGLLGTLKRPAVAVTARDIDDDPRVSLRVSVETPEDAKKDLGIGGVAPPLPHFTPGAVCDAVDDLLKKSPLFGLTGAAHAAALCSACGIVYWSEDISRHNAVDRVVGRCFLEGSSFHDKFLVTTGRINSEMVQKAAACGIRVIASKAPPTDKGIELAERLGITVIGFVRQRRLNVYSHPEIWRQES